jgi:3-methyladenine DNA glycosylase AlkD
MNRKIIDAITKELKLSVDPAYRDGSRQFFKEPIKNYGVRTPIIRKIANKFWPQVKNLSKSEIFELAEAMFALGYSELATIATAWVARFKKNFTKNDFGIFTKWVNKYFDNWAKVDDFCTHNLSCLIKQYPELTQPLFAWTKSKNRWVRRASAVAYIHAFGRPNQFLPQIFKTAAALLTDADDLVQKGYGWMLKEAASYNQKEVFDFVIQHKAKMPRTALRYAIEKMPLKLKQEVMTKS